MRLPHKEALYINYLVFSIGLPLPLLSGGEPEHHCMVPSGQKLNATIPREWKDKKWRYSQCSRYVNSTVSNETTSCDDGWYYDRSEFTSTIVSDVCMSGMGCRCVIVPMAQAPTRASKNKKYYHNKLIYDTFRMAPLNCC